MLHKKAEGRRSQSIASLERGDPLMPARSRGSLRHCRRTATEVVIPRLPLVVQTANDVAILRAHSRAVRRLPRNGLRVRIEGLAPDTALGLEARIRAYITACGCAEGGAAALGGTLAVLAWIATQSSARGLRWGTFGTLASGVLFVVALGGIGKLLGVAVARFRFERYCSKIIQMIPSRSPVPERKYNDMPPMGGWGTYRM